ncbi:hypothetical protein [Aurantiacibacter luteus]|uniref:Uncharacterized protein n=1 Tax=Aurantiacibacter luteus TaxID=1581420 RepID=A0A0G9MNZ4_9SPHN|nr:hypothetical protein [Aurantiacibacter luteus]KLE32441.1 hypothetical protein AAW00_13490 [Aurantiacibacter luteus]
MAAPAASTTETFSLALSLAAPVAELEAWMADAAPGGQVVYATGVVLPRAAAGVQLVQRWVREGLVDPVSRRDPANPRQFQFIAQRRGAVPAVAGAAPREMTSATRRERDALLALLRDCAVRGRECPSNTGLARALDLGGSHRGRSRASYLMHLLEVDGAIRVEGRGRNAPRLVTVLAAGRGRGKSTRDTPGQRE